MKSIKEELLPADVTEGSRRKRKKKNKKRIQNNKRTQNKKKKIQNNKRKKKKRTKKNISGSIEKTTFKNDNELNDMILNQYETKIDDDYQFKIKFKCGASPDIGAIYCDGLAEFRGKDDDKYLLGIFVFLSKLSTLEMISSGKLDNSSINSKKILPVLYVSTSAL